ncbi:MAG: hypothetical protein EPN21_19350 [Methylococcaceae bacterium]|nr:MAG: hypothetical protein EPN21_19350 [Methylococcaceae bacterium]
MLRRICLILWLVLPLGAWAQYPTYTLFNDTNEALNFETLDPGRGTWKSQTTNPHEKKSFSMTSGIPSGKIRIATTSRGYVEYDVYAGGSYRLIWDAQKGMWDFRSIKSAAPARAPATRGGTASSPALPYRLGDSVLVWWKTQWYSATVIQLGGSQVKIHYDGYDNSWDEWVTGNRIRYR